MEQELIQMQLRLLKEDKMISLLVEGFLKKENGRLLEAHSTVTAVTSDDFILLVDTSSKEYRSRLLDGLKHAGIKAEDVDVLILTHSHDDHTANTDLFPNAEIMMHPLEESGIPCRRVHDNEEILPGIRILHTPGHTAGSISVLVEDERCVIAGDAIPTEDNILKNLPPGINIGRDLAMASMHRILSTADSIIPGHGRKIDLRV